jgi:hypothetical protein
MEPPLHRSASFLVELLPALVAENFVESRIVSTSTPGGFSVTWQRLSITPKGRFCLAETGEVILPVPASLRDAEEAAKKRTRQELEKDVGCSDLSHVPSDELQAGGGPVLSATKEFNIRVSNLKLMGNSTASRGVEKVRESLMQWRDEAAESFHLAPHDVFAAHVAMRIAVEAQPPSADALWVRFGIRAGGRVKVEELAKRLQENFRDFGLINKVTLVPTKKYGALWNVNAKEQHSNGALCHEISSVKTSSRAVSSCVQNLVLKRRRSEDLTTSTSASAPTCSQPPKHTKFKIHAFTPEILSSDISAHLLGETTALSSDILSIEGGKSVGTSEEESLSSGAESKNETTKGLLEILDEKCAGKTNANRVCKDDGSQGGISTPVPVRNENRQHAATKRHPKRQKKETLKKRMVKEVGMNTPVKDFHDMLQQSANTNDEDLAEEAVEGMIYRIEFFLNDQAYHKTALSCMESIRAGLLKLGIPLQFNDFLRQIKDNRDKDANTRAFWDLVLQKGITLISNEEWAVLDVTAEMALGFLKDSSTEIVDSSAIKLVRTKSEVEDIDDGDWD